MNIYWSVHNVDYNPITDTSHNLLPFINYYEPESLFSKISKMNLNLHVGINIVDFCLSRLNSNAKSTTADLSN